MSDTHILRWPMLLLASLSLGADANGQEALSDSARETSLVELLSKAAPAAVDIIGTRIADGVGHSWVGAGVVIHEKGYIVTNDHVAGDGDLRVIDANGQAFPARVVGRNPEIDLAVLRVDTGRTWSAIRIGRSHDLMLGEPAIVIGNPAGLSHSVTRGVVSRIPADVDLQVSAPINGGNSGGPVLNANGRLIGIVKAKAGEGLGFAIPIDRVRSTLPKMLLDEIADGYRLGFAVDTSAQNAEVTAIIGGGPAEGKLLVGDTILRFDDTEIKDGVDFYLFAGDREPQRELKVAVKRGSETLEFDIAPEAIAEQPALEKTDTRYGIEYRVFSGKWSSLPNVDSLDPTCSGFTNSISHAPPGAPKDHFALEFKGLISIDTAGAWSFFSSSDDGSRVWINDELVVDNDGLHADLERRGTVRLASGLHSLRVLFFEGAGDEALAVSWQGPGQPREALGASDLLHRARN